MARSNILHLVALTFTIVATGYSKTIEIDLLKNCANIIDLDPDSNGYILVKDSGTKDIDCEMTIQSTDDDLISTRFLEINFPTCDQSELELISILEPNDQYSTFQSQPHFCGRLISDAVDFQQFGEQKWKVTLKTKPKGINSFAAFSFSVHKAANEPIWPPNTPPRPTTTPQTATSTTTVTASTQSTEPATIKPVTTATTANSTTSTASTSKLSTAPPEVTTPKVTLTDTTTTTETPSRSTTHVPSATRLTDSSNTSTVTPTIPADTSTAPTNTPTTPADTSTAPTNTPTTPADTSTAPTDTPTTPADTSTAPTDTPTTSTDTPTTANATTIKPTAAQTTVLSTLSESTIIQSTASKKLQQFRCVCPVSILDKMTNIKRPDAPVVYLDEETSHLWFNITAPNDQSTCDSSAVVSKCMNECQTNAFRFYREYGPNRIVKVKNGYNSLGDQVCQQTQQISGVLAVHSQILDCNNAQVSNSVYMLDREFYCYEGYFCSQTFQRMKVLPPWLTYTSCPEIINKFSKAISTSSKPIILQTSSKTLAQTSEKSTSSSTVTQIPTTVTETTTKPLEMSSKGSIVTTKPQQVRCVCPVSISDATTNYKKQGASFVYLDEDTSHLAFNITVPSGQSCQSVLIAATCSQQCWRNAYKFYRQFGPNRTIKGKFSYAILGDYVCQQITPTEISGGLAVYSQILNCERSQISNSVYELDSQFYCYQGSYCSSNYRRLNALSPWLQYDNCADIINKINSPTSSKSKKCSCLLGVSSVQNFELKMTIQPKMLDTSCRRAVSECEVYCRTEGKKHMNYNGIAQVVEMLNRFGTRTPTSIQVNDLVCEKLKLRKNEYVYSKFYSQVSRCLSAYTEGTKDSDRAIKLLYNMPPSSFCN